VNTLILAPDGSARTWIDDPLTFRTTVPDELAQGQTVASGFRGDEVKSRAAGEKGAAGRRFHTNFD